MNIARTLLKEAPILLLDEPTNGLDAYNENRFINLLLQMREQGKTIIIVSHKLNLALAADNVLCFDREAGTQMGTHDTLYAQKDSNYAQLYDAYLKNSTLESNE